MRSMICLLIGLAAADAWAGNPAGLLVYKVWEPGLEPYIGRILVTPGHVRMDEGMDHGDFTLFDREQGTIRNVSVEDQSVLLDFDQQYDAAPELFLVPASYREISIPGLSFE